MEKEIWRKIKENEGKVPEGMTPSALLEELYSLIGSTDGELRDEIGLELFYSWLTTDKFSHGEMMGLVPRLLENLHQGLGEEEGDGVFLRSFSALWLGFIVEYDRNKPFLGREAVLTILEAAISYLEAEADQRAIVPGKGWAHATAHTADLLVCLARNPHTEAEELRRILDSLSGKLKSSTKLVYLCGEEARLGRAAIAVFLRGILPLEDVQTWLQALAADWQGAWLEDDNARAYHNQVGFLNVIHWRIPLLKVDIVPQKEEILKMIEDVLEKAEPWQK